VQENLTALKLLAIEAETQARTEVAATRTYDYARIRYEAGIVGYLDVIESQRTLLAEKMDSAKLLGTRQTTLVQLIKALGGGWNATAQPALAVTQNPP